MINGASFSVLLKKKNELCIYESVNGVILIVRKKKETDFDG